MSTWDPRRSKVKTRPQDDQLCVWMRTCVACVEDSPALTGHVQTERLKMSLCVTFFLNSFSFHFTQLHNAQKVRI